MKSEKTNKSYFSKKVNTEDFNYMSCQVWFTLGAALFLGILFWLVKIGVL